MPWQTVDARPQKRRKGDAVEDAERRELRLRRTYNEAAAGHAAGAAVRTCASAAASSAGISAVAPSTPATLRNPPAARSDETVKTSAFCADG